MPVISGAETVDQLPVFTPEPDAILFSLDDTSFTRKGRIRTVAANNPRFIRQTQLRAIGASTLTEALDTADEIFKQTASSIGAQVVPHTWGLYPTDKPVQVYFTEAAAKDHGDLVPEGYVLAAEVAAVKQTSLNPLLSGQVPEFYRLTSGIRVNGYRWADHSKDQYLYGIVDGQQDSCLWLVDIEPVLDQI